MPVKAGGLSWRVLVRLSRPRLLQSSPGAVPRLASWPRKHGPSIASTSDVTHSWAGFTRRTLSGVFQEQLKQFFLSPEQVAGALSQADQEVQAKVDLHDALRREADRLKAEADEVFQLYLAKEITARALGERHQPIEDRRVELEAEIPRLQGEIDFLKIQHLSREEVVSEAEDLYDRWEELTPHDRRAIVQAIVERVTVGTDEIEITLSCLPRPPEPPLPPVSPRCWQLMHESPGIQASTRE